MLVCSTLEPHVKLWRLGSYPNIGMQKKLSQSIAVLD